MRVPLEELIDLERLGPGHRPPTAREIRAALPRGWVLEPDGRSARRDLRLFFREGWILLTGLALFGAAGAGLLWRTLPPGWTGIARLLALFAVLFLAGGVIAPRITRALHRR